MSERRSLRRDDRGAIMVISLFMAVMLVGFLYYLAGVGDAIVYRERMQDAADAGAFSTAVVHARGMNILALINMIMAAALAVLVALKVIETLIIAGIVIAGALAFVTFGASLAAIPPLKTAQQTTHTIHDRVKPAVFKILEIGHKTAPVVRNVMPVAGQVKALTIVRSPAYRPPAYFGFAWPIHEELPTTDGSFGELCERAGENVGEIAGMPFDALGIDSVAGWLKDKTGDLAKRFSRWFCSGEGDPPEIPAEEVDVAVPELDVSRECRLCGSTGTCTPERSETLCSEAREAEKSSFPDEHTGKCQEGSDGDTCRWRVEHAREACEIGTHENWLIQERTIDRYFWRDPETHQVHHRDEEVRTRLVKIEHRWPCGFGMGAATEIDPDLEDDVCGDGHNPPETLLGSLPATEATATRRRYTYRPVLFGCSKTEERTFTGGAGGSVTRPDDKVPQRIIDDVELGDDRFQIRYVVMGRGVSTKKEQGVRMAAWGKGGEPPSWQDLMRYAGRFSVAQAEFYWNGNRDADRKEWLWSMEWRARLRRFRMPEGDGPLARSKCFEAIGTSSSSDPDHSCNQMSGMAGWLDRLIAH